MKPAPLPSGMPRGPVSVREARALGVGRGRLRRGDIRHPVRGVVSLDEPDTTLAGRAAALSAALTRPHAFSHRTALDLLALPVPESLGSTDSLDVMTETAAGRVRRRGCVHHRGLESRSVTTVTGLSVVDPMHTWCDLGDLVGSTRLGLGDLVMVGDAVLARAARGTRKGASDRAEASRAALAAVLSSRVRPRGKRGLEAALPLLDHRSKSPMESWARVIFHEAGLPRPEINVEVFADDGSGFLGEFDFVWRAARVAAEYQGGHHADRRQRAQDSAKLQCARDEGWTVLEIWVEDLRHLGRRVTLLTRLAHLLRGTT
ncbi:MAG: hypothetical protein LCH60_04110 [Actinobacteria bacterium]|nr:hypothetical protein [Actinomycetota bacterium]